MWPITSSVQGSNTDATHINTLYIILTAVGSLLYESGSKAAGELPVMLSHVCLGGLPGNDTLSWRWRCQVALCHTHILHLFVSSEAPICFFFTLLFMTWRLLRFMSSPYGLHDHKLVLVVPIWILRIVFQVGYLTTSRKKAKRWRSKRRDIFIMNRLTHTAALAL